MNSAAPPSTESQTDSRLARLRRRRRAAAVITIVALVAWFASAILFVRWRVGVGDARLTLLIHPSEFVVSVLTPLEDGMLDEPFLIEFAQSAFELSPPIAYEESGGSGFVSRNASIAAWPFALFGGVLWFVSARQCRAVERRNACPACGYPREGLDAAARCPECGSRRQASGSSPSSLDT